MKRNIYLDYFRGFSALAVMLYHYATRYDMLFGHVGEYPIMVRYGSYGVLVFFLLSGYLTFSRESSINTRTFLQKRFLRLYPSYWIALTFTAMLTWVYLPELSVSLKDFLLNFTMVQMYLGAKHVDGAYWTLACELFFYVFVWLICVSRIDSKKAICGWFVLQTGILLLPDVGAFAMVKKFNDLLYFHCFMAGGLISLIEREFQNREKLRSENVCNLVIYSVLCIFFVSQQFIAHEAASGFFMIIATGLLGLAVWLYDKGYSLPLGGAIILKPIAWFAAISYPFYLLHQNIGYIIIKRMESVGMTNEIYLVSPFLIVLGLAYLLHRYVEKPLLKYCNKKF